ncbi:MAG: TMEM175 family protein [Mucilaginibacter sp.]
MNIHDENEIKKEFQLERIILFTDAVFAIIITIMVLDIKLPEGIRSLKEEDVKDAFKHLVPKFLAYILSFFLIARFWMSHLRMFAYLKDYNTRLIMYNLLFLFCVSLFPFAVSLISGSVSTKLIEYSWGAYTYLSILLSSIFTQTLLARYLVRNKEKLCFAPGIVEEKLKWKVIKLNLYIVPVFVALIITLTILALPAVYALYLFMIYGVIMKRLINKSYPGDDESKAFLSGVFNRTSKRKKLTEKPEDQLPA